MASSDVDQRFLGRIAQVTAPRNALLSASLFQLLGISVRLARKVYRARKLRRLDTSRDTKSLNLYHQIIFMSREGLSTLETYVLPYTSEGAYGPEARVLAFKLRASFCHIFCLFHNQPPVSLASVPQSTQPQDSPSRSKRSDPSSPRDKRRRSASLRDPVASVTSDASFLTNPYAAHPPGMMPTPSPKAPPGLTPVAIPSASSFLLPPYNFVPVAHKYFETASAYSQACLPGSHPLRLSVALERAAFSWDCLHDHNEARMLARQAIKDVFRAQEPISDAEFEDAKELVNVLGRFMKRKSWEGTPSASATAINSPVTTNGAPVMPYPVTSGAVPPVPPIAPEQAYYSGNGGAVQESRSNRHRDSNGADTRSQVSGHASNSPRRSRRGSGGSNHKSRSSKDSKESKRDSGESRRRHSSKETTPILSSRRDSDDGRRGGSKDTTPILSSRRSSGESRRGGGSKEATPNIGSRRDSGEARLRGGGGSKESTPRRSENRSSRESSATITPRTYNLLQRSPRSGGSGSIRLSPSSRR